MSNQKTEKAVLTTDATESELDFSLFTGGEAGYQVLTNEKLKELNKKLPNWSLEPPAKYVKK